MEEKSLIREKIDAVGVLTINRPDKGNSLTLDVLAAMVEALEAWAGDDDVRSVVITGSGDRAFCAGFDVRSIPTELDSETARRFEGGNPLLRALEAVKEHPCPVVAMLNGYALGAGFNLAMCCDIRVAADDVRMGIPPARLGLVYHHQGLLQVIEAIGMARAREVFFTGRLYGPEEVREMGLVNRMVPRSELKEAAMGLAREIADNSPLSLKGIKRILNMLGRGPLSEDQRREADVLTARSFLSEDAREGKAAFLEKRKPRFKGQ